MGTLLNYSKIRVQLQNTPVCKAWSTATSSEQMHNVMNLIILVMKVPKKQQWT